MKYKKSSLPKNLTSVKLNDIVRQISLNNTKLKKIEGLLSGYLRSLQSGPGFDFNEIREYKIGDDLRHISWRSTAKTGRLQTKEYLAEKEIRAYFLIDISSSMFCGNKFEPFLNLFVFLLNKSSGFCEKIGGIFFSEDIKYHFPLSASYSQSNIMFQEFFNFYNKLKDKTPINPTRTNLAKGIDFARKSFSKKGIVFIISDFVNLINWEKSIFDLSQKQNIYSFQIYDPIDFQLSKSGYITLIDPETKERFIVNTDSTVIHSSYNKLMQEKQNKLNDFLNTLGIKHILIEKEDFTLNS